MTFCEVFTTAYYASIDDIEETFLKFVKRIVTKVIHRKNLHAILNQSRNRWSQLTSFSHALIQIWSKKPPILRLSKLYSISARSV